MRLIIVQHWPEIISIVIALLALYYSVKAWQKSRAIYGVERMVIRHFTGGNEDIYKNEDKINEKLSSGNYSILSVMERTKGDKDWELLLGRITPYKNSEAESNDNKD